MTEKQQIEHRLKIMERQQQELIGTDLRNQPSALMISRLEILESFGKIHPTPKLFR
jgi:hypothetical protein